MLLPNTKEEFTQILVKTVQNIELLSGLKSGEWIKLTDISPKTYAALRILPAPNTIRLTNVLRILKSAGAKIQFSIANPETKELLSAHDFESDTQLNYYIHSVFSPWYKSAGFKSEELSKQLGLTTASPLYLISKSHRGSVITALFDVAKLGFTVHLDIKYPRLPNSVFPKTIPDELVKLDDFKTIKEDIADARRLILINIIQKHYQLNFDSIASFARTIGVSEPHSRNFLKFNSSYPVSMQACISVLGRLNYTSKLIIKHSVGYYEEITIPFNAHSTAVSLTAMIRKHMAESGITIEAVAGLVGNTTGTLTNRLRPVTGNSGKMETYLNILDKMGYEIHIEITHPDGTTTIKDISDSSVTGAADGLEKIVEKKKQQELEKVKHKSLPTSFIDMCDDSVISAMQRGTYKTSLGETVRAFL